MVTVEQPRPDLGLRLAQKDGASVVVASSRSASVDRALAELPGATGRVADLGDPGQVTELMTHLGPIDHLVYTAGEPLELAPVRGLDLEEAERRFRVRYFGALAAVSAADVRRSIVLMAGTASPRPAAGWALGASVCAAIEGLTRTLAVELAPVRVNANAPGVLRSPLWSSLSAEAREGMYSAEAARLPAGRVGEVEDAAEAIHYLLAQTFTTGAVLGVDGGALLV